MAKDRIVIREFGDHYYLTWFIVEDEDYGATIGEREYTKDLEKATDPEAIEEIALGLTAKGLADGRDTWGYYWETVSGAKAALRAVKLREKTLSDERPLPEWAVTAAANGWKPPKGWKP